MGQESKGVVGMGSKYESYKYLWWERKRIHCIISLCDHLKWYNNILF